MQTAFQGKVWKFGDKVSTDLMVPGAYVLAKRGITDEEAASYTMRANRPDWAEQVKPGDIMVAGVNLACGSSRNWARPIQVLGISVALAESISRIGLRNAINTGLPALVAPGITDFVDEGERLDVDLETGRIRNLDRETEMMAQAWSKDSPPYQIMAAGGFMNYFKQQAIERGLITAGR